MRVGVDATSWLNRRGFGRFTRNAVSRLVALDPDTTYVLFVDSNGASLDELPDGAEVRVVAADRPATEAAAADSNRSLRDLLRLIRAARGERLSAFLFTSLYTYVPLPGVPTVVGIHDTIGDDHPELTFPGRRARTLWSLKQRLAVRTAARLFTVSAASREALVARGVGRGLEIVPEAPDPVFTPRSEAETRQVLDGLGIDAGRGYFLYAGGISPHKNIETLLDAYGELLAARGSGPMLVLVGDLEAESYVSAAATVRRRIAELGLDPHVVLPGFVSDASLACLYTGATAAVLPSLAEGFGLPAVEAAACGAPVILSDLPAHRESLGAEGGLYFAPRDVGGLVERMALVADDPERRAALASRGRSAVSRLTWDAAAVQLRELLRAASR